MDLGAVMDEVSEQVDTITGLRCFVGKAHDRSTRDRVADYCDGSGAKSIKAVVESGTYTAFDSVRVARVEFDVVTIGGIDYLAALFELDIIGDGA
jgi:hypothetical protein